MKFLFNALENKIIKVLNVWGNTLNKWKNVKKLGAIIYALLPV